MATTTDFRNGLVIRMDNELWMMVEFQHVKPGKGGAFVRTRLKNVKTGRVIDRTFRSGEKVDDVRLEKKKYQFLYGSESEYVFMEMNTYEQITLAKDVVGDASLYIKDGMEVEILSTGTEVLGVEAPIFVELEIVKTDPGIKGDTASGGSKPATLETGAVVQVPLFIQEGEVIRVDTRTSTYVERVK
ncbi:elongation factor P [bacterium]|nr:elongation factor P [bacterium]